MIILRGIIGFEARNGGDQIDMAFDSAGSCFSCCDMVCGSL